MRHNNSTNLHEEVGFRRFWQSSLNSVIIMVKTQDGSDMIKFYCTLPSILVVQTINNCTCTKQLRNTTECNTCISDPQQRLVFFIIRRNSCSLISPSPSLSASSIISCGGRKVETNKVLVYNLLIPILLNPTKRISNVLHGQRSKKIVLQSVSISIRTLEVKEFVHFSAHICHSVVFKALQQSFSIFLQGIVEYIAPCGLQSDATHYAANQTRNTRVRSV